MNSSNKLTVITDIAEQKKIYALAIQAAQADDLKLFIHCLDDFCDDQGRRFIITKAKLSDTNHEKDADQFFLIDDLLLEAAAHNATNIVSYIIKHFIEVTDEMVDQYFSAIPNHEINFDPFIATQMELIMSSADTPTEVLFLINSRIRQQEAYYNQCAKMLILECVKHALMRNDHSPDYIETRVAIKAMLQRIDDFPDEKDRKNFKLQCAATILIYVAHGDILQQFIPFLESTGIKDNLKFLQDNDGHDLQSKVRDAALKSTTNICFHKKDRQILYSYAYNDLEEMKWKYNIIKDIIIKEITAKAQGAPKKTSLLGIIPSQEEIDLKAYNIILETIQNKCTAQTAAADFFADLKRLQRILINAYNEYYKDPSYKNVQVTMTNLLNILQNGPNNLYSYENLYFDGYQSHDNVETHFLRRLDVAYAKEDQAKQEDQVKNNSSPKRKS